MTFSRLEKCNYQRECVRMTELSAVGALAFVCWFVAPGSVASASLHIQSEGEFMHDIPSDVVNEYSDLDSVSFDFDNYSEVNITNASDSTVIIAQKKRGGGDGNRVRVDQEGVSNTAILGQYGRNNSAYVNQQGNGNYALVGQIGGNNEALVNQTGDDNVAFIGQANLSNTASKLSVNQAEDNNVAFITGSGGANLGISQDGGDVAIINASSSMSIYINQAN